eukprot:TRINITY_DN743_c3_g1_i1.p1 TRINITY_DN743_c3_g1~~TRINITY_DN743_c3_g1_i1.p1  ORF type:complete len:278 (+),score=57.38 TRINITY_DN743_c3_g1_i1:71-904(+)
MMYREEESIYNLLPKPIQKQQKPPMHISKHHGGLPPSYSTFCTQGTGRLQSNCEGSMNDGSEAKHKIKMAVGTMGKPSTKIDPKQFLKRSSGKVLPPEPPQNRTKFERKMLLPKRPSVPTRTDKPVMGLITEKNFVIANAVDNIMMPPKRVRKEPDRAVNGKNYAKTPKYLERIQHEINEEVSFAMQQMSDPNQQNENRMREMSQIEKEELITKMKAKWEDIHKQYLSLTFSLDTISKISRKEALEAELEQLEKAITKLSKKVIYVYDDGTKMDYRY